MTEFSTLARALGEHPSRLVLWDEGALAMRLSDERYVVTRRGARLAKLKPGDMVHLDLAKMAALAVADVITPEELESAQFGPGKDEGDESAEPCRDALLFAVLLSMEGVRFAAHVHPIVVDMITASPRGRQFAERRMLFHEALALGATLPLVPYADPGAPLAQEVKRRLSQWRERYQSTTNVILLQNHGVILLGNSAEDVVRTVEMLNKYAEVFVGAAALGGPVFLSPPSVSQVDVHRQP